MTLPHFLLVSLIFMSVQMRLFYVCPLDKGLANCITDDIKTCNKDGLGAELSLYMLFKIPPHFLKFSSILIDIQIR